MTLDQFDRRFKTPTVHNRDSVRDLRHKSQLLGLVRALKRDGMFGHSWPFGYVVHRGVIVVFDPDHDTRVLGVIDRMRPRHRDILLAAHEAKGGICFIWACDPPPELVEGEQVVAYDDPADGPEDGDWWPSCNPRRNRSQ